MASKSAHVNVVDAEIFMECLFVRLFLVDIFVRLAGIP